MPDLPDPRSVTYLTDPVALRALAHPTRMRLLSLLRREGPLTATQAGERLGESSGTCSFHLRQLARHGLVAEVPGVRGRSKPWRATAASTSWTAGSEDKTAAAAALDLTALVTRRYTELLAEWAERAPRESPAWRDAAFADDTAAWLAPEELSALARDVANLLDPYLDRAAEPGTRPAGARRVAVIRVAFPLDDQ
jgi:predicted ArsR family transcriptional regulator